VFVRRIVGVTGAPGAGKSSYAAKLATQTGAVVVPMDGFHLSNDELRRLGRLERKGAPDTFDAAGYVALLRKLRTDPGPVRAPAFDRRAEAVVPNAITVPPGVDVITEGNYLLLDEPPWDAVRPLLDEAVYVEVPERLRIERLVARHVEHGRTADQARERAERGSDAANARLVRATRHRADRVITLG
jgi:pantothenate kinase